MAGIIPGEGPRAEERAEGLGPRAEGRRKKEEGGGNR